MNILVAGGAGYIGSVAVKELVKLNHNVSVIDNLSKGKKELVDSKAELFVGDLTNRSFVESVFEKNKFDAIIHFAAYKAVEESMEDAPKYSQNIIGSINILDKQGNLVNSSPLVATENVDRAFTALLADAMRGEWVCPDEVQKILIFFLSIAVGLSLFGLFRVENVKKRRKIRKR